MKIPDEVYTYSLKFMYYFLGMALFIMGIGFIIKVWPKPQDFIPLVFFAVGIISFEFGIRYYYFKEEP